MKAMYGENERDDRRPQPDRRHLQLRAGPASRRRRDGLHQQHRGDRAKTIASSTPRLRMGARRATCCASATTTRTTRATTTSVIRARTAAYEVFNAAARVNGAVVPGGHGVRPHARSAQRRQVRDHQLGVLHRGQLAGQRQLHAELRPATRSSTTRTERRELHQDGRHVGAAPGLLLGHQRRQPHEDVRQRRPLLPAGGQRHQHQAGRSASSIAARSTCSTASIANNDPILGEQLGAVDNSQGDGTVPDVRGEVDPDMDPVYQDEVILGFQSKFDRSGRWAARHLPQAHNAIDDMEITCNGSLRGEHRFVMGNPGESPPSTATPTATARTTRSSTSTRRTPAGRCTTRTATSSARPAG